jgi:hypothetical protein
VSTTIILASQGGDGKPMRMRVSQTPDEVREAWASASGQPFSLTAERDGGEVWVNPAGVISWRETSGPAGGGPAGGG